MSSPTTAPPSSHLVWGVLTTIFCCLPFGIVSIVYAAQVSQKWAAGDVAGAIDSSQLAKKWAITSAVVAVLSTVVTIAIWGIFVGFQFGSGT